MKETYNGKNVFISGGNGVIGNELVKILYEKGANIFVGDLKPRPIEWPQNIMYRQGDLNYITFEELSDFKPEIFFHLAATFERSTETYDFWDENFQHNINLSHHLMTLFKKIKSLNRVVFASSYLIYDQKLYQFDKPQHFPFILNEEHPIFPRNLTGMAKLAHEIELQFLSDFKETHYSIVSARIFRGYGKNSRDVISRWIRDLLNNKPIYLYKKEGMFDYIYAKDTAEGLSRLGLSNYSGIINLGTGKSRKVIEIVEILKNYFPQSKVIEVDENIQYEASQANVKKLLSVINWTPEYNIEKSIPEIIEYEKKRNGKYEADKEIFGNILITSISKKIPLIQAVKVAAKKISKSIRIFGGDINNNCIGKYFVDEFWHMPKLDELSIDAVIKYCKEKNINAIIPTRDGELHFWALYKKQLFQYGINVMVSNLETVDLCLDKLHFYNSFKNNFPLILTSNNIQEIQSCRFVVKEQFGAGSLEIAIDIDYSLAQVHAKKLKNPIFQPFIEGVEISVDVYVSKSNVCKGVVLRKRNLIVNGESQITTTFKDEDLENLFKDFALKLQIYGHAVFQAIIDNKNNVHIIECNSRFGGASTLSIKAGLDSFYWFLLESNAVDIAEYFCNIVDKELTQIRYPNDICI